MQMFVSPHADRFFLTSSLCGVRRCREKTLMVRCVLMKPAAHCKSSTCRRFVHGKHLYREREKASTLQLRFLN